MILEAVFHAIFPTFHIYSMIIYIFLSLKLMDSQINELPNEV